MNTTTTAKRHGTDAWKQVIRLAHEARILAPYDLDAAQQISAVAWKLAHGTLRQQGQDDPRRTAPMKALAVTENVLAEQHRLVHGE